ncbi:MAG TPA: DUF5946 family protein, partial [Terriglobales bacterium]|nr:DUF5946 family protein [Terriglobales bacterium]
MRCEGCGLEIDGGTGACQAEFERLIARDFTDPRFGRTHRLLVDTYSLQHPDRYCASAKSLAAHLTGLCCALELQANPAVYRALQHWLNGAAPVERPEPPV